MSPLLFKRLSDENLGSRLASGEAAAFDELYRRYAHRLAAYGSHLLGDAAAGDDVAQAAMLKAYGALRDGRQPDKLKPWLYRIAHNVAIDLVARRRELSTEMLPEQSSGEREPFAGALVEALATLPDRQRRVYVLREVHGLRIDETAAELGLTAAQVEQSLFAARNRLAEQLVFGDRLNCVTVQRLAAGPLDPAERRALKTHLRTCHECRGTMGLRGRALSFFPSGAGLEWLRNLGPGLIGGGAPAAAKIGAVFATATIVGGGSVAVERTNHRPVKHAVLDLVALPPAAHAPRPEASLATTAVQVVAATSPPRERLVAREHTSAGDGGGDSGQPAAKTEHQTPQNGEHGGTPTEHNPSSPGGGEHTASAGQAPPEHSGKTSEGAQTVTQPTETQPTDTTPSSTQPTETQPTETTPSSMQPTETQPTETTTTTITTTSLDTSSTPGSSDVTVPSGD